MSTADRPSRRYLRAWYRLLARLALASLVFLVVASVLLVLFFDPLFQYALARASRDLNGTLTVGRATLGLGNFTVQEVRLTAPITGEVFTADAIVVKLHPWSLLSKGLVEGIGEVDIDKPGLRVVVDQYGVLNLSTVLPTGAAERAPLLADYEGTVTLRDGWVLYRDERSTGFLYQLRNWEGTARFGKGIPALVRFTMTPDQPDPGKVAVHGQIGIAHPRLDLSMKLSGLALRPFSVHPSVPASISLTQGVLTADLWVRGEADDWGRIETRLFPAGTATLEDVVLRIPDLPWPIEFGGKLSLTGGTGRILKLAGKVGKMTFSMSGNILLEPRPPWVDATVQAAIDLAQAATLVQGQPLQLQGTVELDLGVEGPLDSPAIAGWITSARVLVDGEVLEDLKASFELDRQTLELTELSARTFGGALSGSGWVFLDDPLRLALKLRGENAHLPEPLAAYAGAADFDVTVLGGTSNPLVFGNGSISDLGSWSQGIQSAGGRFLYGGNSLVVWDATATREAASLSLPLAFLDLDRRFVSASVSTAGYPLPPTSVRGRPLTGVVRGSASVWGSLDGLQDLKAQGFLEGTELSYAGLPLSNLTGRFLFSDRAFYLPGMRATLAGGEVQVAGQLDPFSGRMDLGILGQGVGLAALTDNALFQSPFSLTGSGDFSLSVAAGGHRDHFLGHLDSDAGRLAAIGYRGPGTDLGLVAFAEGVDVRSLPLPGLERIGGELSGMLGLQGAPDNARFLYTARISDGTDLGLAYVDANGEGVYTGDALVLRDTMLSWDNPAMDQAVGGVAYTGHAFGYFGPVLARPLEIVERADILVPDFGLLTLSGRVDLARNRLNLRYRGRGLEMGWLASRPWLGGGRTLNDLLALEIETGLLFSEGRVSGTFADPGIEAAVRIPWLTLAGEDSQEGPRSILALAGHLDLQRDSLELRPLVLSAQPYDPRLPQVDPGPLPARLEPRMMKLEGRAFTALGRPTLDLRVWAREWPLQDLVTLAPNLVASVTPYGRITTHALRLWGSPRSPSVAGKVVVEDGGVWADGRPIPLERAAVAFSSHHGAVHVSGLDLKSGPLELHGSGSRTPQGDFTGSVWSQKIPLAYLHSLGPPLSGLSGDLDMALSFRTRRGVPTAYVALQGEHLQWDPRVLGGRGDPFDIRAVVLGRMEKDPDGALHTGAGLGVALSLSEGRIQVDIPEQGMAIRLDESATGVIAAEGSVSLAPPLEEDESLEEWFASSAGPDFGQAGQPFRLRVQDLSLAQLERFLGTRSFGIQGSADAELVLEGQWARDHRLASGDGLPRYALELARLEVEGRTEQARSGFRLDSPVTLSYGREERSGRVLIPPLAIDFFREALLPPTDADPAAATGSGQAVGTTTASGRLTASGEVVLMEPPGQEPADSRLELAVEQLPLENLGFLLPKGLSVSGLLESLHVQLAGRLLMPQLSMLVDFSGGRFGAAQFAGISGGLTGSPMEGDNYRVQVGQDAGRPLQIYFGAERSENQKLALNGDVVLDWQQVGQPPDDRLHVAWEGWRMVESTLALQAHLLDQDLKFLATLLPGTERTSGVMRGSLHITGTLQEPKLVGQITVENGAVETPLLGNAITGLNVDTRFEQIPAAEAEPSPLLQANDFISRYSIEKFMGSIGGRPFQMTGKAELSGLVPTFLNVKILGEALPIEIPDLFSGIVDLDISLVGRAARAAGAQAFTFLPVVEGQVVVPQGDISIPTSILSGNGGEARPESLGLPPIRYDLDLTLGDDVWVNILSASVRVQGELQVLSGDDVKPVLAGALFLSRGTIRIPVYEAVFRIRQGWAYFERSLSPVLENVEADLDLGGYRITARFDGRYPDSLRTEFVSNPPLPQAELARLVVMGGLPEALAGSATGNLAVNNFLADQGVSLLSGMLTNQLTEGIGRLLFLSEVTFDYIPPAQYVVKLAKALDRRDTVLLTLTRVVKQDNFVENLFGIEWRFQPNLLVRVARDDLDQFRFWFQSLLRF
ncbi:MAG: translocation/assembly module TamB domain-containing protein [Armatimonadetes bacterium]|nr:translocation/assembly module TamB domain-containing protein [Armatimonadota bacterium]